MINWDIKVCLDIDYNCWKKLFKYKILGAWTFLKNDGSSSAIRNQHQKFVNVKTHGNIFRKLTNPILWKQWSTFMTWTILTRIIWTWSSLWKTFFVLIDERRWTWIRKICMLVRRRWIRTTSGPTLFQTTSIRIWFGQMHEDNVLKNQLVLNILGC